MQWLTNTAANMAASMAANLLVNMASTTTAYMAARMGANVAANLAANLAASVAAHMGAITGAILAAKRAADTAPNQVANTTAYKLSTMAAALACRFVAISPQQLPPKQHRPCAESYKIQHLVARNHTFTQQLPPSGLFFGGSPTPYADFGRVVVRVVVVF